MPIGSWYKGKPSFSLYSDALAKAFHELSASSKTPFRCYIHMNLWEFTMTMNDKKWEEGTRSFVIRAKEVKDEVR